MRGPIIAIAVLAAIAFLMWSFDPFARIDTSANINDAIVRSRIINLIVTVASIAVVVYFMVVAWRGMRALERMADAKQNRSGE